jgi:hypothetical protein
MTAAGVGFGHRARHSGGQAWQGRGRWCPPVGRLLPGGARHLAGHQMRQDCCRPRRRAGWARHAQCGRGRAAIAERPRSTGMHALEPSWLNFSLLAARSRCPENLVRDCGWVAGPGRCRSVARGWAGVILVIMGGRGWEYGRGLPVTPSARGMRARKFSLARGLRPEGRLLLPLSTPVSIRGH